MDSVVEAIGVAIVAIIVYVWEALVSGVMFFVGLGFDGWVFFLAFIIPTFIGMEVKKNINQYIEDE